MENIKENKLIGYAYQSRQYASANRSINPLYISSGHRLIEDKSLEFVYKFCR
ncbi:deoxyribonuclease V [Candidatus Nanohalobium constans]|uniref:Deoxyribonuclease V n=1 Tax=Candidatus Nanohalobium constans TaxID=2565781 RepID=A0A5Q0UFR7_9ARCH|nr:deoxyribonuclease V [Candidatus Nanohalobium constans]